MRGGGVGGRSPPAYSVRTALDALIRHARAHPRDERVKVVRHTLRGEAKRFGPLRAKEVLLTIASDARLKRSVEVDFASYATVAAALVRADQLSAAWQVIDAGSARCGDRRGVHLVADVLAERALVGELQRLSRRCAYHGALLRANVLSVGVPAAMKTLESDHEAVDEHSLVWLLRQIGRGQNIAHATKLLHMAERSDHATTRVYTAVMAMLFERRQRDGVLGVYTRMRQREVPLGDSSRRMVLRSLSWALTHCSAPEKLEMLSTTRLILSEIMSREDRARPPAFDVLIELQGALVRAGDVDAARRVCHLSTEAYPDLYAVQSLLSEVSRLGLYEVAEELLATLEGKGRRALHVKNYTAYAVAVARGHDDMNRVWLALERLTSAGFHADERCYQLLIRARAARGDLDGCRALYARWQRSCASSADDDDGGTLPPPPPRNSPRGEALSSMTSALLSCVGVDAALAFLRTAEGDLRRGHADSVEPEELDEAYEAVIRGMCACGRRMDAAHLLEERLSAPGAGEEAAAEEAPRRRAGRRRGTRRGEGPKLSMVTHVLTACSRSGDLHGVRRLLHAVQSFRLRPDSPLYGAIVVACSQAGEFDAAEEVVRRALADADVALGASFFNTAINCFGLKKDVGGVAEMVREMLRRHQAPDAWTAKALSRAMFPLGAHPLWQDVVKELEESFLLRGQKRLAEHMRTMLARLSWTRVSGGEKSTSGTQ